jgi:hypothetical protein
MAVRFTYVSQEHITSIFKVAQGKVYFCHDRSTCTLKKEAVYSSQIMVTTRRTTRPHNPNYNDPVVYKCKQRAKGDPIHPTTQYCLSVTINLSHCTTLTVHYN